MKANKTEGLYLDNVGGHGMMLYPCHDPSVTDNEIIAGVLYLFVFNEKM